MIGFYHRGDLDGHASGAIIKKQFPEIQLYGIDYEDDFPWDFIESAKPDIVVMADFSLPMIDMERLKSMVPSFIWVDHHVTAINNAAIAGFGTLGLREVGTAACELCWTLFFTNTKMPIAVYLLGRFDVWDLKADPRIMDFQFGMLGRVTDPADPASDSLWDMLLGGSGWILNDEVDSICQVGGFIQAYQELRDIKYMARFAFLTNLAGHAALAVNIGTGGSLKFQGDPRAKDADLFISFAKLPFGWLVNLYSEKDYIDCGALAQMYGGGGHKSSAGFRPSVLPFGIDLPSPF